MSANARQQANRIINLIKAIRQVSVILPGDKIHLTGEAPATYLGAIEKNPRYR